jgi:hypothetical protein
MVDSNSTQPGSVNNTQVNSGNNGENRYNLRNRNINNNINTSDNPTQPVLNQDQRSQPSQRNVTGTRPFPVSPEHYSE